MFFNLKMKNRSLHILALLLVLFSCSSPEPKQKPLEFQYEVIADDLMIPWNIDIGPDGYLWSTDQVKKVFKISLDDYSQQVIKLENFERDTFYLLGMAFHPDFMENGIVYLSTLYPGATETPTGYLDVFIAKYDDSLKTIRQTSLIIDSLHTNESHNPGGRMKITEDGKLLVSASCEVDVNDAQDLSNLSGKFLRFNLDGSIPDDNPYPGSPIFTRGHRNPQGIMVMDDGRVFISEHGPSTDDEFNELIGGKNYGWPIVRGICDTEEEKKICDTMPVKEALFFWTPTIAPSSLIYYDRSLLKPLQGKFLIGTLKENDIRVLSMDDNEKVTEEMVIFDGKLGRIRDMAVDSAGNLYLSTANILPFSRHVYDHIPKDTTLVYDVIVKVSGLKTPKSN